MKRNQKKTGIAANNIYYFIIIICFICLPISCISPFEINYKGEGNQLVVDGGIIKGVKKQEINISIASSISNPKHIPLSNCQVKVIDDSGNEFVFTEESQGKYVSDIDDALLNYNSQYKLVFSTPSGENYESGYQKLLMTAPVDNIYSIEEYHQNANPNTGNVRGLQFYVDLNAPNDASKYYKWQIVETWEVHASFMISGIYDGKTVSVTVNPSDSLYYCWKTKIAEGFYTSSTINLSQNIIKKIPLHFKLSTSEDLGIKYCATVRQFALNKDAYDYWHQKEVEMNVSGQIFTSQPTQYKSNIVNTSNPDEKVLGFFWASSCTEKHLFLKDPFSLGIGGTGTCNTLILPSNLVGKQLEAALLNLILKTRNVPKPPVYIYTVCGMSGCIYYVALTNDCIDCRLNIVSGKGTTQKPDFWE
jgi:hypothetical protein